MTSSFKPLRTKFRENLNKNEHFFMQDLFLNIIYKSPAIFSRPQCVNTHLLVSNACPFRFVYVQSILRLKLVPWGSFEWSAMFKWRIVMEFNLEWRVSNQEKSITIGHIFSTACYSRETLDQITYQNSMPVSEINISVYFWLHFNHMHI